MPIPDGSAITTPNQMLDKIDTLTGEVRAMRSEINPALSDVRHDLADHETRLRVVESKLPDELSSRLSTLEQVRWKASGGIALISGLVASGVVAAVIEATRR
jgi:hypothetical protein